MAYFEQQSYSRFVAHIKEFGCAVLAKGHSDLGENFSADKFWYGYGDLAYSDSSDSVNLPCIRTVYYSDVLPSGEVVENAPLVQYKNSTLIKDGLVLNKKVYFTIAKETDVNALMQYLDKRKLTSHCEILEETYNGRTIYAIPTEVFVPASMEDMIELGIENDIIGLTNRVQVLKFARKLYKHLKGDLKEEVNAAPKPQIGRTLEDIEYMTAKGVDPYTMTYKPTSTYSGSSKFEITLSTEWGEKLNKLTAKDAIAQIRNETFEYDELFESGFMHRGHFENISKTNLKIVQSWTKELDNMYNDALKKMWVSKILLMREEDVLVTKHGYLPSKRKHMLEYHAGDQKLFLKIVRPEAIE